MTEILFYHLERLPLEAVLPGLLERCAQRDWRAVVQTRTPQLCAALDSHLWSFREDSFLPHGLDTDDFAAEQPVLLTTGENNGNGAVVRFLVEQASCGNIGDYRRVVYIFDGADDAAVAKARQDWKTAAAADHAVTYWQQDEAGRWKKRG